LSESLVDSFLAVMSLARLWQQQGKQQEAHQTVICNLPLVHRRV
jgi:hypothetical protein